LALEEVVIELPLLKTQLTVKLRELKSAEALRQGNSDLAELDRASNGAVGRQVIELLRQPVPLSVKQVADGSMGSPLVEQAMLVLSSIGFVEGRSADLSGRTLTEALRQAASDGEPTLLSLLKAIPGQRRKQPMYIHRADGDRLAFAGLWEVWRGPDKDQPPLRTCTVITGPANDTIAPIHDRMPVMIPPDEWATWLDPEVQDTDLLGKLLVPAPNELLIAHPVSTDVNNVRNKGAHLIDEAPPIEDEPPAPAPKRAPRAKRTTDADETATTLFESE
jgi:hypothetical protein